MDEELEREEAAAVMSKLLLRAIAELVECKAKSVEDAVKIIREYADMLGK